MRFQPGRCSVIQLVSSFFILATTNAFELDVEMSVIGVSCGLSQEALKMRPMTTNAPNPNRTRRSLRRPYNVKIPISSLMTAAEPKRHEDEA